MRVLASARASIRELTLASFDSRVGKASLACGQGITHSRVGNASLACTRTRSRSVLACDIACDASRSHSFVKLRLGSTVTLNINCDIICRACVSDAHHICGDKISAKKLLKSSRLLTLSHFVVHV